MIEIEGGRRERAEPMLVLFVVCAALCTSAECEVI
jgi:hypothetical protein